MSFMLHLVNIFFRRNRLRFIYTYVQFLFVFLLLGGIGSFLYGQLYEQKILEKSIGDIWTISAHIRNVEQYMQIDIEKLPVEWTEKQYELLKTEFPEKVSFVYIPQENNNINNRREILVSPNLFDRLRNFVEDPTKTFLIAGKNLDKKSEENILPLSVLSALGILADESTEFVIKSSPEKFPLKYQSLHIELLNLDSKEIQRLEALMEQIHQLNISFNYESPKKNIESMKKQNNEKRVLGNILLLFTIFTGVIFIIGVISFLLVRFLLEKGKISLLIVLGATNKHIFWYLLLQQLYLYTPPFIVSNGLLWIIHSIVYPFSNFNQAILFSVILYLFLITISLLPLMYLQNKNRLINELGG